MCEEGAAGEAPRLRESGLVTTNQGRPRLNDASPPRRQSRRQRRAAPEPRRARRLGQYQAAANRKNLSALSSPLYRRRNLVERFFNKIKRYRDFATRYDKRADNFLAGVKLVPIRIGMRVNESTIGTRRGIIV